MTALQAPIAPFGLDFTISQIDDILAYFESGRSLTQEEARTLFSCSRLAARVWDLRQAGHLVRKRMVRDPDGRLVAEYYLEGRA